MGQNLFAERFKEAMNKQGMKQVDLLRVAASEGVKLGKSQISQYVSGKAVPRENIGLFLAETLKVDVRWLYGKEEASNQSEYDKSLNQNNSIGGERK